MIPKVIHYCWFGEKPLNQEARQCISSWRKFAPGFEIKEWNETNYDVKKNKYITEAYINKKYAFVSDYARLDIIYHEGGIYLDVDVELVKPITHLVGHLAFMGKQTEFNGNWYVNTGLGFGAEAKNTIIKSMLDDYENSSFIKKDGSFDTTSCPIRNTKTLSKYNYINNNEIQDISGLIIYPSEYFCPMDHVTGKINVTDKTISIHRFAASWISPWQKIKKNIKRVILNYEEKLNKLQE